MKKFAMIALALILSFSLAACGRSKNKDNSTTTNTTADNSTFDPTIIPDMDPTMDTNIPDPSVDTRMPMGTDEADTTGHTDAARTR